MLEKISSSIINFSDFIWSYPLLLVLLGGGLFLLVYSRFLPFFYFKHAIRILAGKYDNPDEPGHINHYQALSTAVSGTVGMGNVSSVAIAIATGGPGAMFWMWLSAFLGVAIKFFTCSLAVMYRGHDSAGVLQGGPMYFITHGLGKNWRFLAVFFSVFGMIGVTSMFQSNQLTQVIRDVVLIPNSIPTGNLSNLTTGIVLTLLVFLVVLGGIKRIGKVAGRLVPFMVIIYIGTVLYIIFTNPGAILPGFALIFKDAFSADAVLGGALGTLIITGVRRAAFSNEAGIGTAPMAHGAAKTSEPIREGLIAMLGPVIDTLIICTMTALALIITGAWTSADTDGITMTANAFDIAIPGIGPYILTACVTIFALTTMFAYPYYGTKCFSFLFGVKYRIIYMAFYLLTVMIGALGSLKLVISVIDAAYALMAFPTMIAAVLLAPKVMKAAKKYFGEL